MPAPILIHSAADARAALTAAEALGCPVTLLSARAAAAHGGVGWFQALIDAASAAHPGVAVTAVLDCADLPGLVLGALRAGLPAIRFTGRPDVAIRLEAIAAASGATVFSAESLPGPGLDLRTHPDPVTLCRDWLRSDQSVAPRPDGHFPDPCDTAKQKQ